MKRIKITKNFENPEFFEKFRYFVFRNIPTRRESILQPALEGIDGLRGVASLPLEPRGLQEYLRVLVLLGLKV